MTTSASNGTSDPRTLAEIESAALRLEPSERMELMKLLAGSIEGFGEIERDLTEEDRKWLVEIERRVNEIRQGKVIGRDGETVIREALARFS